VQHV
jgi:hypothetical protein